MKPRNDKTAKFLLAAGAIGLLVYSLASANAQTDWVMFTQEFQPEDTVLELNLNNFAGQDLKITARSRIDEALPFAYSAPADSSPAGVTSSGVTKNGGIGVSFFENGKFSGSSGISGGGGHKDEELIFSFSKGVLADDLVFVLADLDLGGGLLSGDDPIVFLDVAGFAGPFVFHEGNGLLDAGVLTPANFGFKDTYNINIDAFDFGGANVAGLVVNEVRIRETNGHTYLNSLDATAIPEPSSAALLAFSMAIPLLRRRRK